MNTLHIKKGMEVVVLAGNEKGKTGKVLRMFPKANRALVEGVGMKKRNQRARTPGEKGQIIDKQHPIAASKLMNVEVQKERAKKRKK